MAAADGLFESLEVSRGRLEAFVKGAVGDAVQHTLGLVKSHLPEADLDPVGDGVPEDCSNADWEANHTLSWRSPSASWPSCDPPVSRSFYFLFYCKKSWSSWTDLKTIFM